MRFHSLNNNSQQNEKQISIKVNLYPVSKNKALSQIPEKSLYRRSGTPSPINQRAQLLHQNADIQDHLDTDFSFLNQEEISTSKTASYITAKTSNLSQTTPRALICNQIYKNEQNNSPSIQEEQQYKSSIKYFQNNNHYSLQRNESQQAQVFQSYQSGNSFDQKLTKKTISISPIRKIPSVLIKNPSTMSFSPRFYDTNKYLENIQSVKFQSNQILNSQSSYHDGLNKFVDNQLTTINQNIIVRRQALKRNKDLKYLVFKNSEDINTLNKKSVDLQNEQEIVYRMTDKTLNDISDLQYKILQIRQTLITQTDNYNNVTQNHQQTLNLMKQSINNQTLSQKEDKKIWQIELKKEKEQIQMLEQIQKESNIAVADLNQKVSIAQRWQKQEVKKLQQKKLLIDDLVKQARNKSPLSKGSNFKKSYSKSPISQRGMKNNEKKL